MNRHMPIPILAVSMLLTLPVALGAVETGTQASEPQPQAHNNHRGPKQLVLENGLGAKVTLWKPDLTTQPVTPEHGMFTMPKTGMDNYHAVIAERDWGNLKETVIRYEYQFGKPSKRSPSELAGTVKTDFEIIPDPIPREHYRYHSNETWGFLLRLHGEPAQNIPVSFESENGSQMKSVTDERGYVSFRLPDDFPDIVPGERDRRSAGFTITAETENAGITYQTMLTADYRVAPEHWQSTQLGLLVAGIGLITGGLIGRVKLQGGKKK
ncbi:MAG: hypothetical protein KZQ93_13890 [Candidatus Thiodiazotropha sp. (ex Monitilora ramsayi)]|nr:hypothetical protein [Candidatus Thiodiazotropha sp. (ex Monitilora ramsayi)]